MSSKKNLKSAKILLLVILAGIIIISLFFLTKAKEEITQDQMFTMSSNAQRVKFLNEQGLIVNPDPVLSEEIIIPSQVNDIYQEYIDILNEQGFNIKPYMGKTVLRLSYEVLNYPNFPEGVVANMLLSDDRLIGGDITKEGENGFIRPLLSERSRWDLKEENTANSSTICENTNCKGCLSGDCDCLDCANCT